MDIKFYLQVSENCILKRFKPFKTADVRVADLNISFELGFANVLKVRSFKRHRIVMRSLDAVSLYFQEIRRDMLNR